MTELKTVELGTIAEIVMGTSPPGSSYNHDGFGDPLLNGPTEFGPRHPDPVLFTTEARRYAEAGDLLFCVRGSTTGRMNWADRRYAIGRGVAAIRGRSTAETCFLRAAIEAALPGVLAGATGATMPNLNVDAMRRIPVPAQADRERAGLIFATLDDLLENSRRRVEVLEEMARATYREWFVRFRYPGHENAMVVDSPLGPIPEDWETPQLAELVTTQYGYTESANIKPVGPRYLRGMDINKTSFIDWSVVPFCPIGEKDRQRFKVEPGDVFVIRMADPGKVGMCEVEVDAVFASYLVRLRPEPKRLDDYFLFFTLRDDAYQDWVTGASTGATRKSVSAKVMTEPRLVLPPWAWQMRFRDRIEPMRRLISGLVMQNNSLSSIRELLLPRIVSGQLDVSKLNIEGVLEESVA